MVFITIFTLIKKLLHLLCILNEDCCCGLGLAAFREIILEYIIKWPGDPLIRLTGTWEEGPSIGILKML